MEGKSAFYLKVAIAVPLMIAVLTLLGFAFEHSQSRFGGLGLLPWGLGALAIVVGVIALWASVISWLDQRALRRYRVDPGATFEDGQVVALSGILRAEGEPLTAPFSELACAAYSYQITGQSRSTSGSGPGTRGQLCMLGAHLAPAILDTGKGELRLLAVPDVDTDYREITTGGAWGERAMDMIEVARRATDSAVGNDDDRAGEPDARGLCADAARQAEPPLALDLFVAAGTQASSSVSVREDTVPVGEPLTVLGTYRAGVPGLDGQRIGGMKVFKGTLDERLPALRHELRVGLWVGCAGAALGLLLLSAGWWWPAAGSG